MLYLLKTGNDTISVVWFYRDSLRRVIPRLGLGRSRRSIGE